MIIWIHHLATCRLHTHTHQACQLSQIFHELLLILAIFMNAWYRNQCISYGSYIFTINLIDFDNNPDIHTLTIDSQGGVAHINRKSIATVN